MAPELKSHRSDPPRSSSYVGAGAALYEGGADLPSCVCGMSAACTPPRKGASRGRSAAFCGRPEMRSRSRCTAWRSSETL